MKKKILAMALVVAMLAIAVVSGSLAWFTDTDKATNTFTIGSIEIEQVEDFQQNSQLLPVGSNTTPQDDPNYVKKVVSVKNTGKNAAYVRTFVAVPAALDNGLLHIYDANAATYKWKKEILTGNAMIGGVTYNVYCYTYQDQVQPGDTTYPAIEGVYIDQAADLNVTRSETGAITEAYFVWKGEEITSLNVATMKLDVYVVTQAVQVEGFADADTALDSAFGTALPSFT